MTTPSISREPWDDSRLRAAFAARASRTSAPADLATSTMAALRARPGRTPVWRRLLAPAAVVAVVVIGVTSGFAMLLNGDRGTTGLFRDGPTPALKTFDVIGTNVGWWARKKLASQMAVRLEEIPSLLK